MKNQLLKTATAGLAALVLSACTPAEPPQRPEPISKDEVFVANKHQLARWTMKNLDSNTDTYEMVTEYAISETGENWTIFYAPGFESKVKEIINRPGETHYKVMSTEQQGLFNTLANTEVRLHQDANDRLYLSALQTYQKNK